MAQKFLKAIAPYVKHYAPLSSGLQMLYFMQAISIFMKKIRSGESIILDLEYLDGDSRADVILSFNNFSEFWVWMMTNFHSLQGSIFDVMWSNEARIFDGVWSHDESSLVSETHSPLNDFLINEVITYALKKELTF